MSTKEKTDAADSSAPTSDRPTPVAQMLTYYRVSRGLSLRALAERVKAITNEVGVSHSTLAAIESGKSSPSRELLRAYGCALDLSEYEVSQLDRAASHAQGPEGFLWPSLLVPMRKIIDMEKAGSLEQVWVVQRFPVEIESETLLEGVVDNLLHECSYAYFLDHESVWDVLYARLRDRVRELTDSEEKTENALSRVTSLLVPASLRTFFFKPEFTLYEKKKEAGGSLFGVWNFRGANKQLQAGCEMAASDADVLYDELRTVVVGARLGKDVALTDSGNEPFKALRPCSRSQQASSPQNS